MASSMSNIEADKGGALEQLRMERSDTNPFASQIEFDKWADSVKAALANDARARLQFFNYATSVETAYAFKTDPLPAINNAIGLVNQVAMALQAKSSEPKITEEPLKVGVDSGQNNKSDNQAKKVLQGTWAWLKKFANSALTRVVSGLILGAISLFLAKHFGINLGH